jgi:hypothetical protein
MAEQMQTLFEIQRAQVDLMEEIRASMKIMENSNQKETPG